MKRYSNLLPSKSTLNMLGCEAPNDYLVKPVLEVTPLYLKSVKKSLDTVGFEEYNRMLLEAENKSTLSVESIWYSFEVLLNFYGFEQEVDKIKHHLLEGQPNRRGYKDLLYYFHLMGAQGVFPEVDWNDAGNILNVPKDISDSCLKTLKTLDSNFSTTDLCYALYISNTTGKKFFRKIKEAGDVLHNGFLYEIIGAYCFTSQTVFRTKVFQRDDSHPIIENIIENKDIEVLKFLFEHYNDRVLEVSHFVGDDSKHENEIKRLESLFESTIPYEQWLEYLDMPTEWVEKIASDR